jgi:probable HAF family extracellular repeat protein
MDGGSTAEQELIGKPSAPSTVRSTAPFSNSKRGKQIVLKEKALLKIQDGCKALLSGEAFKMQTIRIAACAALITLGSGTTVFANPTILEFDPPGATSSYVLPNSIDARGNVAGSTGTFGHNTQPYFRTADGAFLNIGPVEGEARGIGHGKSITGLYIDSFGVHGFIAQAGGTTTPFDVPGSNGNGYGTVSNDVNRLGSVAGTYSEAGQGAVGRGFVRDPNGNFATFDAPNAGTSSNTGTFVRAINAEGYVVGWAIGDDSVYHAFERVPDGSMISIDLPGQGNAANQGSSAYCIDNKGKVGGIYYDTNGKSHGFLRNHNGALTIIDIANGFRPRVYGVNRHGVATGNYYDANGLFHGYVRSATGELSSIDAPDAGQTSGLGTFAQSINDDGVIAGYYLDSQGHPHSFIRFP